LSAFGLLDRVQVGDTGPAESTRRGNLQRVGLLFLGSRDNNNTPMQTIYNITNMFNEHDYENKHENQHFTKTDPYWLSKKNFSLQKLMQTKGGKSNQKNCKIQ
jgi:hypothetical protein